MNFYSGARGRQHQRNMNVVRVLMPYFPESEQKGYARFVSLQLERATDQM